MISELLNFPGGQAPRPPNGMPDFSSILSQLPSPKLAPPLFGLLHHLSLLGTDHFHSPLALKH